MEYPFDQTAWRRGWNITKTIWTNWQFFVLDAVVAVIIGGISGWYWGLAIVIFGMVCGWIGATASAPYKQRDEARAKVNKLEKSLGEIGFIDALRWEAHADLQKLRLWQGHNLPIDAHEIQIYRDWLRAGSEWMQRNMYDETVNWYHRVDIGLVQPTMDNVIQAYESGFTMLGEIIKATVSSI